MPGLAVGLSSIKICRCDSSQSSSNKTPLIMVSSLGHLVASLSGTLNFVSQVCGSYYLRAS